FFFSSRRRHTRCYRDWSSDVCSSDLIRELCESVRQAGLPHPSIYRRRAPQGTLPPSCVSDDAEPPPVLDRYAAARACFESGRTREPFRNRFPALRFHRLTDGCGEALQEDG